MKKNLTELVFILDRSGSMSGLEADTIGGYNSVLEKQKKAEGEANVTTVLFDDCYEMLHQRLPIKEVKTITEKEYYVRGCTALLDAIGRTICYMEDAAKHGKASNKAQKVLFIITTDGCENSSREFTLKQIRRMIEKKKEENNWEFLFLGANIDAVSTAESFGISRDYAVDYIPDEEGTMLNYMAMDHAITACRSDGQMDSSWKAAVEEDYARRKPRKRL